MNILRGNIHFKSYEMLFQSCDKDNYYAMPKMFRHHLKDATVHYEELISHNAQVSTITQS
jgi:hypothetical protein